MTSSLRAFEDSISVVDTYYSMFVIMVMFACLIIRTLQLVFLTGTVFFLTNQLEQCFGLFFQRSERGLCGSNPRISCPNIVCFF